MNLLQNNWGGGRVTYLTKEYFTLKRNSPVLPYMAALSTFIIWPIIYFKIHLNTPEGDKKFHDLEQELCRKENNKPKDGVDPSKVGVYLSGLPKWECPASKF